jgi:predicted deacylase
MQNHFPSTYEESRERFRREFEALRGRWQDSSISAHPISADPSLSIEVAWARPAEMDTLVMVSTGVHGIEGYAGSAMLKLFMDEFTPRLDPAHTGLLLVHAVNPWGMKHRRRYNENNVDLNRNFLWDQHFDPQANPDYEPLNSLLNPARPITNLPLSDAAFAARLVTRIAGVGIARLRNGTLSGQYRHPTGIQFGGQHTQDSTRLLRDVMQQALESCPRVVHFDMHTGYGPRYQMSFVNALREKTPGAELRKRFNYPLILAASPGEFYTTTGDITEYFYQLHEADYPQKQLFSTCFEFGTFGESLPNQIRSMRATILENRLHQHGTPSPQIRQAVRREYEELFLPTEERWRSKAMQDCRQGLGGVLAYYGLLSSQD